MTKIALILTVFSIATPSSFAINQETLQCVQIIRQFAGTTINKTLKLMGTNQKGLCKAEIYDKQHISGISKEQNDGILSGISGESEYMPGELIGEASNVMDSEESLASTDLTDCAVRGDNINGHLKAEWSQKQSYGWKNHYRNTISITKKDGKIIRVELNQKKGTFFNPGYDISSYCNIK